MSGRTIITVLGSGTSTGVPLIGCNCPTCASEDPHDKRLRTSIMIEKADSTVVIDTTPDFRQQMLRNKVIRLDAVVYTHAHFDHIAGFDDLRAYNYWSRQPMNIFSTSLTYERISETFPYAFGKAEQVGGGIPIISQNEIIPYDEFSINEIKLLPLILMHGKLEVMGYRMDGFAYLTDTNFIPEETFDHLHGVDTLIIDCLKYTKHPTHFCLDETMDAIEKINPKIAYLIHLDHNIRHAECEDNLPLNVRIAYDGMEIEI